MDFSLYDHWTILSEYNTRQIYEMFHHGEEIILTTTEFIKDATFKGGFEYRWNPTKQTREFDFYEKEWIERFLRNGINYKWMYGMVPYLVEHDLPERGGRQRIIIPDICSGRFLAKETSNGQVEIGFQLTKHSMLGPLSVEPTPNVNVYVWPDSVPTVWMDAPFKSTVHRLLRTLFLQREFVDNAAVADSLASQPPIITQHNPGALHTPDQQFEEQVYADVLGMGDSVQSADNQQRYRVDRESSARQFSHVNRLRAQTSGRGYGSSDMVHQTISSKGTPIWVRRIQNWQRGMIPLPVGQVSASYQMPQSRSDLIPFLNWSQETISLAFGVPMDVMKNYSISSNNRRTGSSAESCQIFKNTVCSARRDMKLLFETAWETVMRDENTKKIAEKIVSTKDTANTEKVAVDEYIQHLSEHVATLGPSPEQAEWMKKEIEIRHKIYTILGIARDKNMQIPIAPDRIREVLEKRTSQKEKHVTELTGIIDAEKRMILVWPDPALINWEFVFKVAALGFVSQPLMLKLVNAEIGVSEEDNVLEDNNQFSDENIQKMEQYGTKSGGDASTRAAKRAKKE